MNENIQSKFAAMSDMRRRMYKSINKQQCLIANINVYQKNTEGMFQWEFTSLFYVAKKFLLLSFINNIKRETYFSSKSRNKYMYILSGVQLT